MATAKKSMPTMGAYVLSSQAVLINLRLGIMALWWLGIIALAAVIFHGVGI